MASSRELLPAPVGPVIANKSSLPKSITQRSRKLVNPCNSSLIGRTSGLRIKRFKCRNQLRQRSASFCLLVKIRENFSGQPIAARLRRRLRAVRIFLYYVQGIGKQVAYLVSNSWNPLVGFYGDAKEVISQAAGHFRQLL